MSNQNQRLGKGLEALIPKSMLATGRTITTIPISQIRPNAYQPRHHFDDEALCKLAGSIQQHGLAQPLLVRKSEDGYELIAGERRFRACKLANIDSVSVVIRNVSDKEALQLALVENLEREDLNPIEVAMGYQRLQDEFQLTHQSIAQAFGRSRSGVTNTMRLLNLPEPVQQAVAQGRITEGHARMLLLLPSAQEMIDKVQEIEQQGLNVREVEAQLSKTKGRVNKKGSSDQLLLFKELAGQVADCRGWKVAIKGKKTKGKIEIRYNSEAELMQISKFFLQ